MRPVLLLLGFVLVGASALLSYQHLQQAPQAQAQATPSAAPSLQPLEPTLTASQGIEAATERMAPRINLAPKSQNSGARFVKPPAGN